MTSARVPPAVRVVRTVQEQQSRMAEPPGSLGCEEPNRAIIVTGARDDCGASGASGCNWFRGAARGCDALGEGNQLRRLGARGGEPHDDGQG